MAGFFQKLFGGAAKGPVFRQADWLEAEGKLRLLEAMAASNDQTSSKQMIIQADVLVDSIMKQAGVPGSTMGERLKYLKGKMPGPTYSRLWQAHIKRNELVHDAGSFVADWEKQQHFRAFKEAISAMRGIHS